MRYLSAIAGILGGLTFMVFFGIGSSTFIRSGEKAFATLMLLFGLGLFGLSVATLFVPSLFRANLIALLAWLALCTGIWLYVRH